jgi:hypothetical protein
VPVKLETKRRIWRETVLTLLVLLAVTLLLSAVEAVETATVHSARVHLTGPDVRVPGLHGIEHDLAVLRNSLHRSLFRWFPALSLVGGLVVGLLARARGWVWLMGALVSLPAALMAAALVIDLPLPAIVAGSANLAIGAVGAGVVAMAKRRITCSIT